MIRRICISTEHYTATVKYTDFIFAQIRTASMHQNVRV
uniref:Uncharacterized protein n=1 Tax=Anguilla anguilla TaxID=7936 RepID=A0A0E9S837_ANGAN